MNFAKLNTRFQVNMFICSQFVTPEGKGMANQLDIF
jgi:hypothetical protein